MEKKELTAKQVVINLINNGVIDGEEAYILIESIINKEDGNVIHYYPNDIVDKNNIMDIFYIQNEEKLKPI